MKYVIRYSIVAVFLVASLFSVAHPGHGNENPLSPQHYLFNVVHLIPIALTLAVGYILYRIIKHRKRKSGVRID